MKSVNSPRLMEASLKACVKNALTAIDLLNLNLALLEKVEPALKAEYKDTIFLFNDLQKAIDTTETYTAHVQDILYKRSL